MTMPSSFRQCKLSLRKRRLRCRGFSVYPVRRQWYFSSEGASRRWCAEGLPELCQHPIDVARRSGLEPRQVRGQDRRPPPRLLQYRDRASLRGALPSRTTQTRRSASISPPRPQRASQGITSQMTPLRSRASERRRTWRTLWTRSPWFSPMECRNSLATAAMRTRHDHENRANGRRQELLLPRVSVEFALKLASSPSSWSALV